MSEDSKLHTIGVVGCGAMGAGIAQIALTAGLNVLLHDSNRTALDNARAQIQARLARLVEKGQLAAEAARAAEQQLELTEQLSDIAPAQIVIEAIIEQLEPKQRLFASLEQVVAPDAVLATNTSSLSVSAIAMGCRHRERVCGMHFFNPVPLMQLVEVIGAADTSEGTLSRALALAQRLGKRAVRVKDAPGFLVNLIGRAYPTEALHIQQEGVAPVEVIDRIMRDAAGFRMGPFELMDLTGIDVNFPATRFIYEGFQHDPRLKSTLLHESLFKAGRFGRKTGRGFHSYGEKSATPAKGDDRTASREHLSVFIAEPAPGFDALVAQGLELDDTQRADALLVSPVGEDAATAATRLSLDPARVVAIDFTGAANKFLTLMAPVGGNGCVHRLASRLISMGHSVAVIRDSPAFVAPRILAMIVNLACEVAQIGISVPADIDLAMRLAQNYPRGPFEWAELLGPRRVFDMLRQIQEITGSDRYRPSLWLRRRGMLGLPIGTAD